MPKNLLKVIIVTKSKDNLKETKENLKRQTFADFSSEFCVISDLPRLSKEGLEKRIVFVAEEALEDPAFLEKIYWAGLNKKLVLGSNISTLPELIEEGLNFSFSYLSLNHSALDFDSGFKTDYIFLDAALNSYFKKNEGVFFNRSLASEADSKEKEDLVNKYRDHIKKYYRRKKLKQLKLKSKEVLPGPIVKIAGKVGRKLEREGLNSIEGWKRSPIELGYMLVPDRFKKKKPRRQAKKEAKEATLVSYNVKTGKKKKVLILCPWLVVGGVEAVLFEVISCLSNEYDFGIVTSVRSENAWTEKFREKVAEIYHLPEILPEEEWESFLISYIKNHGIELLFITNTEFGYDSLPLVRRHFKDVKVIDLLHGELPYAPMDYFRYSKDYREYIDKRVVITERLKAAMSEKYDEDPGRVTVISNSIDTTEAFSPSKVKRGVLRSKYGIDREKKIILYVGRYAEEKGPDIVLKVAKMYQNDPMYRFIIEGEGPTKEDLAATIKKEGLTNVILDDTCTNVPGSLADADFLIFPSKREGLPMLGIEALSMGKVIIAADVPGWNDLIKNGATGYLINREMMGKDKSVFEKIFNAELQNKKIMATAREEATALFDRKIFGEKYKALFQNVLGDR